MATNKPFPWVGVLCGALVATVCTYWARNHPTPTVLEPVVDALNVVHASVFLLSAALSSNPHDPPLALEYGVLCLTYVLLFLILAFVFRLLNR